MSEREREMTMMKGERKAAALVRLLSKPRRHAETRLPLLGLREVQFFICSKFPMCFGVFLSLQRSDLVGWSANSKVTCDLHVLPQNVLHQINK